MSNKRQIFGWAMYDWANSAYVTTVAVAVLPVYFAGVVVGENGYELFGTVYDAKTLWGFMMSVSALWVFLCAPFLGAIADYSSSKKKFLMLFCYTGSLFATLLYFCGGGDVLMTMAFFILAQIGFVGGNVFYDAFLPDIADADEMDWVSGKGFAYGYVGGGIQFAISLGLVAGHDMLGISESLAARLAMAMAGLWWAGFSVVTFVMLKENGRASSPSGASPAEYSYLELARIGLRRTLMTAKKVGMFKHLLIFLFAYMIYNDGIQTVISMATIYGSSELGFPSWVLMVTLLIIQFIAFFGSLLFGWIAGRTTTKTALLMTLCLWTGVVVYAYTMTTPVEYFILGVVVGLAMGGSQALSRSLYGSMIPVNASAEFYGFYSVFSKFSSIWGPAVFAVINHVTGSARGALVSLSLFFIIGMTLLVVVNVDEARKAARIVTISENG